MNYGSLLQLLISASLKCKKNVHSMSNIYLVFWAQLIFMISLNHICILPFFRTIHLSTSSVCYAFKVQPKSSQSWTHSPVFFLFGFWNEDMHTCWCVCVTVNVIYLFDWWNNNRIYQSLIHHHSQLVELNIGTWVFSVSCLFPVFLLI